MAKRIIVGLIMALIGLAVLLAPWSWVRLGLLCLLMIIANSEMLGALRKKGYHPTPWPGYVFSVGMPALYIFLGGDGVWSLFILLILAVFVQRIFSKSMTTQDVFNSLTVLLYPLAPFMFLVMSACLPAPIWQCILMTGIAAACCTDTFAYFSGMLFGKHKLLPDISPKKTVEGAVGGFVFGMLSGLVVYFLQGWWGAGFDLWMYLGAAAAGSVAGQIGDLAASSIKREMGVKDFGNLIPGHGGILDRLDSILFAVPMAYLFFRFAVIR